MLGKVDFKKLKILSLSNNQISDIFILKKIIIDDNKFENLKELDLNKNKFDLNGNNGLINDLKNRIKKFIYK